jgi:hypothetical protein
MPACHQTKVRARLLKPLAHDILFGLGPEKTFSHALATATIPPLRLPCLFFCVAHPPILLPLRTGPDVQSLEMSKAGIGYTKDPRIVDQGVAQGAKHHGVDVFIPDSSVLAVESEDVVRHSRVALEELHEREDVDTLLVVIVEEYRELRRVGFR